MPRARAGFNGKRKYRVHERTVPADKAIAQWTACLTSAYRPCLGAKQLRWPEGGGVGVSESQVLLIAFVLVTTGLLLTLEVGMRRAQRRR